MARWRLAPVDTATFGWLAFVLAALVVGNAVGTRRLGDNEGLPGDSGRMAKILDESFQRPAGETVLIESATLTADSRAFQAAIADVARRVARFR